MHLNLKKKQKQAESQASETSETEVVNPAIADEESKSVEKQMSDF